MSRDGKTYVRREGLLGVGRDGRPVLEEKEWPVCGRKNITGEKDKPV